ncbi:UDP-glucose/GDP-mannose dehydrogenase family protein [Candidatus Bathyarchaeota archaeon]|nr:UDP-glucose/GDP-mannose dehydrogenase family protein [Candidatus Bathyarchaeota archaeon]
MSHVAVIGLGYVGLTMAACLASRRIRTIGVDTDSEKMATLASGRSPIDEPRLEGLISRAVRAKTLQVTQHLGEALRDSEIVFVTVGTPSLPDGSIDLGQVTSASESMGEALREAEGYRLVVVRSTVVPGTCDLTVKPLLEKASGKTCGRDFGLCANPEFLKEGSAVQDMLKPDRLVIGEYDDRSGDVLEKFYRRFYKKDLPTVIRTTPANAELIKYANNAFLATKISFINMMANLCERIQGCDVEKIAEGIGLDQRIGPLFLRAGLGWGGSCFLKDLKAILAFAKGQSIELPILDAALRVNMLQPLWAVQTARKALGSLQGRHVAILGLAFKPDTDDLREAVSVKIIDHLLQDGAIVNAYDPAAMQNARAVFGDKIIYSNTAEECVRDADCCILVTEWKEFQRIQPEDFKRLMRKSVVIDGRRIYDPRKFSARVEFYAVGLGER